MNKFTWSRNKNDELWQHDSFDTIEECIEDAKYNYDYEVGETIAVGEAVPFTASVDAKRVLGRLEEDAYEECGEASEGWLDFPYKNTDGLSEKLTECVNEWLKETKQEPCFYTIHNAKDVEIV